MDTTTQIRDAIRDLANRQDTAVYLPDMFAFASDADAKLMALTMAGHVTPTRVASTGERQVWEFQINGELYLLTTQDTGETWEGFEPKDAGSFDRLAADMDDADLHTFVA